ncbi:hypothetical protein A3466_17800 [Enterobacter genomosp. S]|uniref:Transposase DDE domain-containing protein n=1 Tax=Enterobacter genomosp. S TaxID=2364151 RepID=A0ABR5YR36_9ENTR|nr:hypothetical protein A3466_17800 [Enterobacter genomosp. S]
MRESTLFFGQGEPAHDEKIFLRFKANQPFLTSQLQCDMYAPYQMIVLLPVYFFIATILCRKKIRTLFPKLNILIGLRISSKSPKLEGIQYALDIPIEEKASQRKSGH